MLNTEGGRPETIVDNAANTASNNNGSWHAVTVSGPPQVLHPGRGTRNDEDFENVKGVEHSYPLTDCVSNVQPEMILNERKTVYRN